jgi:glutathione transport system permease protein
MAGPKAPESVVIAMRHNMGLDQPIFVQYWHFLTRAVHGDFGQSVRSKLPVLNELVKAFPYTLRLILVSYFFAVVFGLLFGIMAAIYQSTWIDSLVMLGAILGASIANFWLALMAMDIFAVKLHVLPLFGAGGWKHYVMPTLALSLAPAALVARMTRSSMLEVINQDYIRTALAKGVRSAVIYRKHALRNALIPIVTIIGLNLGVLLGGAVVTETVFNWPGLGHLLVTSVRFRDYPIIQGITLITVIAVVLTNLAADLAIAVINPRVRFD